MEMIFGSFILSLCNFQLAVLHAELERMNTENQRLKDMLSQVTSNYNTLQMHLMSLMQNQSKANNSEGHGVFDGKAEEKKGGDNNGGGAVVPRQFMDLGLAAANGETDEPSLSSSEERRSGSAGNNIQNGRGGGGDHDGPVFDQEKKDFDRAHTVREDGPDHSNNSQGWVPNKVPRFNSSKEAEQTEATMRKARVSVRARSEAPMVLLLNLINSVSLEFYAVHNKYYFDSLHKKFKLIPFKLN